MKKLISGLSALAIAAAIAPMSAFAENETGGTTNVKFNAVIEPAYTITIPANVDFSSGTGTATIKAENVYLDTTKHKAVVVTLVDGDNTDANSTTFHAKNGDSVVEYIIKKDGTEIKEGDEVARFTTSDEAQTAKLTFTPDATKATYAGTHTEVLTFGVSVENAAAANPYLAAELNSVVQFAGYDWYVIAKETDGVTLLMKDNLMNKAYNDSFTDVTWETCSLRSYLNGEFYNNLTDPYKANIIKTHNSNPNNGSTSGGNATDDYIYLLSIDEAKELSDTIRDNGNWWWLRSPGDYSSGAAFVYADGDVYTWGSDVVSVYGVRPALNLKFE